jgi:hypothetical protein
MANFDLYNLVDVQKGLSIGAITTNTTTSGDWIDTKGSYGVMWSILSGTITDGVYTANLQDADESDYSDAANVASDFVIGTYAGASYVAADDNTAKKIGYAGKKRYVRLQFVSTSVTTGGTLSATAQVGIPRHAPAA